MKTLVPLALLALAVPLVVSAATPAEKADYEFTGDYPTGAPGRWDYLTFEPSANRLYAAHVDKIEVIDAGTGKTIGRVGPLKDAHGVAIVPDLGKGYADSGDDGVLHVFDLKDLAIRKTIKIAADADGVAYDPGLRVVLVVAGDSKSLSIVNVDSDTVVRTVPLPGKPEFLAVDGHGNAFINLVDSGSIARVDISSGAVTATWPLAGCQRPHGLAYDPSSDRLLSGCANSRLIVVDAKTGRNVASLPIGPKSDAVVVDVARGRAMSSNGDGTLTVLTKAPGGTYVVNSTVLTFFGGRNMAVDPKSGTLFVAHGNMKVMSAPGDHEDLRFGWDGMNVAILKPGD